MPAGRRRLGGEQGRHVTEHGHLVSTATAASKVPVELGGFVKGKGSNGVEVGLVMNADHVEGTSPNEVRNRFMASRMRVLTVPSGTSRYSATSR